MWLLAPATKSGLLVVVPEARGEARTSGASCVSLSLWSVQYASDSNFSPKIFRRTYKIPVLRSRRVETNSILTARRTRQL